MSGDGLSSDVAKKMKKMVGAAGFELATYWSQTSCATRLRYAPKDGIVAMHFTSTASECINSQFAANATRQFMPRVVEFNDDAEGAGG